VSNSKSVKSYSVTLVFEKATQGFEPSGRV